MSVPTRLFLSCIYFVLDFGQYLFHCDNVYQLCNPVVVVNYLMYPKITSSRKMQLAFYTQEFKEDQTEALIIVYMYCYRL